MRVECVISIVSDCFHFLVAQNYQYIAMLILLSDILRYHLLRSFAVRGSFADLGPFFESLANFSGPESHL